MSTEVGTSEELFERSRALIPGGVNSPVRAFGSVGGTPRFISSAQGPWLEDVDGQRYLDLVGGWGPALLGHAHPVVVAAVQEAASRGLGFGAATEQEAELAELIRDRLTVPVAGGELNGAERIRLVSTGTEATMTAIRLARAATGRDVLIKFAGHYHGHSDSLLAEAGSGLATFSLPASAGVTAATAADTLVLPYNDLAAVREAFAQHEGRIAAVITEAAAANMGVVPPAAGVNAELARIAHENGALLILDEVLTGFRVGPAGWWGYELAQGGEPYLPDLLTFGKVIGGGMPVAAVAGRAEVMELLAPLGPVYQAGTLSGNPVAVAAGIATLQLADEEVYRKVDRAAADVAALVSEALHQEGVEHAVQHAGSLFSFFFGGRAEFGGPAPRDYAAVKRQQAFRYAPFFHALLSSGVYPPPSVFEAWFLSASHDADALEVLAQALPAAARAAARPAS